MNGHLTARSWKKPCSDSGASEITRLTVVLLFSLVTGCASKSHLEDESWRLVGKLSVRTPYESRILGITWHQGRSGGDIVLSGALGVKIATITTGQGELAVDTGRQVLTYREGDTIHAEGIGVLKLPWQSLAGWVRGTRGDEVRAGNWRFEITESGPDGPVVMSLQHPEMSLKLRVRRWEIAI